jgi:quinol-cytochrome oxidoreductase complex cytochrome b subunit
MNRIMIYRNYSTTILISPVYSIGFCASIMIIIQIISGYILASNYIAETNETFNIVNNIIMRELDTGWLIRYNHINGCGILFIVIYMHMYRTIYYNSISKTTVWIIGVVMYIILCGIAFTGYSLVYGQMSLWAIVVICSLVTAIPIVGKKILILIWGGSVVSSVTLQRIFSVHYILPLIIILLIILHLYNLHAINSTGDMYSISNRYDRISFYPLLLIRDIYIGSIILIVLNVCVYYYSDIFVHSDNYIPANPLVTPSEIMPEFYLLPFYALVRAIPNKVLGIVIMILFILSLSNIGRSYYNNSMIIHRSLLIIMVIDIYLSSNLCLLINHNESFYILIIMSVIGVMSNGINSSINSNSNNTILIFTIYNIIIYYSVTNNKIYMYMSIIVGKDMNSNSNNSIDVLISTSNNTILIVLGHIVLKILTGLLLLSICVKLSTLVLSIIIYIICIYNINISSSSYNRYNSNINILLLGILIIVVNYGIDVLVYVVMYELNIYINIIIIISTIGLYINDMIRRKNSSVSNVLTVLYIYINSNSNNTILNIVIVLIIDILINIRSIVLMYYNISNNMIGLSIVLVLIIHIYNNSMNRYSNRNNNNEIVTWDPYYNMLGLFIEIMCNYKYISMLNKCNSKLCKLITSGIRRQDILEYKFIISKISIILPESAFIIRILILGINMDKPVNLVLHYIDEQVRFNIVEDISIYRRGYSTTLLVIQDNNKIINSVIVLYNNNNIISSYTISKYNI